MNTVKKILVADDVASIRRLFEIGLEGQNFAVTTVKNGLEAVEAVKKEHFDLLIIDLRMPRLDGFGAVEKIRTINPNVPIILQGSFKNEETATKALELGINAYLVKPYDWGKMVAKIEELTK